MRFSGRRSTLPTRHGEPWPGPDPEILIELERAKTKGGYPVSLVMLALGLGADSFRVSAVLSALDSTRRHRIVLTFGVCDGLATAAGLASGWSLRKHSPPEGGDRRVDRRRKLHGLLVIQSTLHRGAPASACRGIETAILLALSFEQPWRRRGARNAWVSDIPMGRVVRPLECCDVVRGPVHRARHRAALSPHGAQRAQLSGAVVLTLLAAAGGLGLL